MVFIPFCKSIFNGNAEYSLNFDSSQPGSVTISILDSYTKSSSSSNGTTAVTYERGLTTIQKEQILYDFVHDRFSSKATAETEALVSNNHLEKEVSRLYRNEKILIGLLVVISAVFANYYFRTNV